MFRVMMTIDGAEVPSSCIYAGSRKACDACRARMMRRDRHPSVGWVVLPCIA